MKLELKFREKLADLRSKFPEWNIEGWGKTSTIQHLSPPIDDLSPRSIEVHSPRSTEGADQDDYYGHRFPAPPNGTTRRPGAVANYADASQSAMNNHNNTATKAVHCSMKVLQSVNTFIDEHLSAVPISFETDTIAPPPTRTLSFTPSLRPMIIPHNIVTTIMGGVRGSSLRL
jgi:hypothetical protein